MRDAGPQDAMTERAPQAAVPTLTEVIDWPVVVVDAAPVPEVLADAAAAPPAASTDEEVVDAVLAAVQAAFLEADGALDQRLRDMLEPALARFADALITGIRADFAVALRQIAADAVAQELGRYRRG